MNQIKQSKYFVGVWVGGAGTVPPSRGNRAHLFQDDKSQASQILLPQNINALLPGFRTPHDNIF